MIGKFNIEQLDEIMEIWLETNLSAHSFINETVWKDAFLHVKSALPQANIYVLEENHEVKGFIGITQGAYIAGLFVAAQHQSMGIGHKLLDYCKLRYDRLELDVFVNNGDAVRFYQNNGFEITQTQTNKHFGHEEYHMLWTTRP